MARILITGADGFIGRNLAERNTYEWISYDGDVRDLAYLSQAAFNCDAVVHLAAISGVRKCEEVPDQAWSTNVGGTANVAALGLPFVLASTAGAINGDGLYAKTKRVAEYIAQEMGGIILRFANVYGPYMDGKDNLISNAVRAAKNGRVLTIHGDGEQQRDFVHVNQVCDEIESALSQSPGGIKEVRSGEMKSVNEMVNEVSKQYGPIKVRYEANA